MASKEKLKSVIIITITFLLLKCDRIYPTKSKYVNSYIDTIIYKKTSSQTGFLPHIVIRASIVNRSLDTILFITSKKDFVSYSNDLFKIDNTSDDSKKYKLRSTYLMPIKNDSHFYYLNPSNPVNKKIIVLPHETKRFELYRNYYNLASKADSIKLSNYLKEIKIRYINNMNYDSLTQEFPNYIVIRTLLIERLPGLTGRSL